MMDKWLRGLYTIIIALRRPRLPLASKLSVIRRSTFSLLGWFCLFYTRGICLLRKSALKIDTSNCLQLWDTTNSGLSMKRENLEISLRTTSKIWLPIWLLWTLCIVYQSLKSLDILGCKINEWLRISKLKVGFNFLTLSRQSRSN